MTPIYNSTTGRVSRRRRIGEYPAHLLQELKAMDKWEVKRMQIAASMKRIKN